MSGRILGVSGRILGVNRFSHPQKKIIEKVTQNGMDDLSNIRCVTNQSSYTNLSTFLKYLLSNINFCHKILPMCSTDR